MKILMVTMGLEIGGAETHILELCRALAHSGHDVTVASNGGVYVAPLTECGIRHIKLPLNTKSPAAVVRSYRGLYRLIKDGGFDVVHAHARIPAFICALIRKRLDFRFTTTAHLDFKINPILKAMTHWGERTLAVSEDIKKYLIDNYGVPADNIALTINGIDSEKFSPDTSAEDIVREFGLLGTGRRIVYISRLDADRSAVAYHLIENAETICREYPGTEMVIVGSGGDYDELTRLAEAANERIGRRAVIMTGGRTDINKLCAAADIFIGVSRSALEAMASGKPTVVAGNQGYMGIFAPRHLDVGISTNFCCRGLEEPTAAALLRDLRALLSMDDAALAKLGEYNRAVVMEHYSVKRMADDYIALYDALPPYTDFRYADIVVSGYYGFGNMGDDSLLGVITENIRTRRPSTKIAVLTKMRGGEAPFSDVRCVSRTNIPLIRRQLSHAKLLISGGGTLIQDGTSSKSLLYYLYIMRLARRCGAKLYIYANGAGPLYRGSSKKLALKTALKADKITVREPDAKETLVSLGVPEDRIAVTADPAFMIKPDVSGDEVAARFGLVPEGRYFAVSLRECTGKVAKTYDMDEFCQKTADACRRIMDTHGLTPVFIPMQPKHDAEICARVRDMVGSGIIADGLTAKELCALLTKVELVLGMRLHMLVFASHMCVPMIAISYDPKINGLMNYLGQPYLLDVQDFTADAVYDAASDILGGADEISDSLAETSKKLTALALTDVDNACEMAK